MSTLASENNPYRSITFVVKDHNFGPEGVREIKAHRLALEDGCLVFRDRLGHLIRAVADWSEVWPK